MTARGFLNDTQPKVVEMLGLDADGPKRQQLPHRLQGEIAKRGLIDVLRNGMQHGPAPVILFCGRPSPGNAKAAALFKSNIFSVTRQLRYSKDSTRLALDLCIFINGLPIITFELKNRLTKQTVADAVEQYKRDRDPRELLFQFKRCAVHFAVDDEGRGLDMVTDKLRPRSVHGLDTDRMRARTDCGRGCGLDTATASRPDNGADTVRLLRGYCAEIASDIPADVACPLRGYSAEMVWTFVDIRRTRMP